MLFLVLFGFASFFSFSFFFHRYLHQLITDVVATFVVWSCFLFRLLSHVKNEDLLMISSAPVLPVLLNNKKNRCNLIFYSNVLKMKDFEMTSICFPTRETSASMELNIFIPWQTHAIGNSLEKSKTLILLVSTFTGRSHYTSPFLKRLTIIWMKGENIQTLSASSLDWKRL